MSTPLDRLSGAFGAIESERQAPAQRAQARLEKSEPGPNEQALQRAEEEYASGRSYLTQKDMIAMRSRAGAERAERYRLLLEEERG